MTAFDRRHTSVLGREAVEWLAPRDGGIFVDATFGAGGYSRAILEVPGTRVIGIDRDRTAIAGGFDLVRVARGIALLQSLGLYPDGFDPGQAVDLRAVPTGSPVR